MQPQTVATQGVRGGLPVRRTSFVDRRREMHRLEELLKTSRCITLTGVGGAGKTRVALEAAAGNADQFERVWWVELAGPSSRENVASQVALRIAPWLHPEEDPLELVVSMLGARRHLLVLDGCDVQLESCAVLADELLRRCPRVVILATSREPLSVDGEAVLRVDPLEVRDDAVQLFLDRAEAAAPGVELRNDLAAVRTLCERLDGIPLAIELAAPWVEVLAPGELLPRLDDRFALPGVLRGGPDRQRTLRATIDWSHDLLTGPQRTLFRRLAVFSGGFTVEAMEAVCGGGEAERSQLPKLLLELSRKSLVQAESAGGQVWHRLLETVRQYANERLQEAGEAAGLHDLHLAYFLKCAESSYSIRMQKGPVADECRIERERDNVRTALVWARDRDPEKAAALAGWAVQETTVLVGVDEGRQLLRGVLERSHRNTLHHARALNAAATLAAFEGDIEEATALSDRAASVAGTLGDRDAMGWAEMTRFMLSVLTDRADDAHSHAERAVNELERSGNRFGYVRALIRGASVDVIYGRRVDEGELERGLEMAREMGDAGAEAAGLSGLGFSALRRGDRSQAVSRFRRAVDLEKDDARPFYLLWLVGLAAALSRSDPWRAMRLGAYASGRARHARFRRVPPVYERVLAAAREQSRRLIGTEEADRAWDEGIVMTREDAIEEAMRVRLDEESKTDVPGGLTRREFEVAREVATGRTNREIAEGMYLSVRTVENHVEHALSKLGLNRRTQLAAWIQSLRQPNEVPPEGG